MRLQPAVMTWIHRAPEKGSGGKWVGEQCVSVLLLSHPYTYTSHLPVQLHLRVHGHQRASIRHPPGPSQLLSRDGLVHPRALDPRI